MNAQQTPQPAGDVYASMVGELLEAEYTRRAALEARGATVITTTSALLTIIFGLSVVVIGKDHVFASTTAVCLLIGALAAFTISAALAIVVQTYGFKYKSTSIKTLRSLTGANWSRTFEDAQKMWISRQVNTIVSLRRGNNIRAEIVRWSLITFIAAMLLLVSSISTELLNCGVRQGMGPPYGPSPQAEWHGVCLPA